MKLKLSDCYLRYGHILLLAALLFLVGCQKGKTNENRQPSNHAPLVVQGNQVERLESKDINEAAPLTNCMEIGLIEESQCDLCLEIEGAQCRLSVATKEKFNKQCFECVEKTADDSLDEEIEELTVQTQVEQEMIEPVISKMIVVEQEAKNEVSEQEVCSGIGFLARSQCGGCVNCVTAQRAEDGTQCFRCSESIGSTECVKEEMVQNCSVCSNETENCQEVKLVVFSRDSKSPMMDCFQCIER